jgi:hypothetical protein
MGAANDAKSREVIYPTPPAAHYAPINIVYSPKYSLASSAGPAPLNIAPKPALSPFGSQEKTDSLASRPAGNTLGNVGCRSPPEDVGKSGNLGYLDKFASLLKAGIMKKQFKIAIGATINGRLLSRVPGPFLIPQKLALELADREATSALALDKGWWELRSPRGRQYLVGGSDFFQLSLAYWLASETGRNWRAIRRGPPSKGALIERAWILRPLPSGEVLRLPAFVRSDIAAARPVKIRVTELPTAQPAVIEVKLASPQRREGAQRTHEGTTRPARSRPQVGVAEALLITGCLLCLVSIASTIAAYFGVLRCR